MDFTSKEREYLDAHPYKIEQLWNSAKNNPIINLPIDAFEDSLKSKFWDDKEGNDISPYEVLANPEKAPYHIRAINKADLNYPLIVSKSNLDVLDGLHRLCKSILEKKTNIDVQKISVSDLKKSIRSKKKRKTSKKYNKKTKTRKNKESVQTRITVQQGINILSKLREENVVSSEEIIDDMIISYLDRCPSDQVRTFIKYIPFCKKFDLLSDLINKQYPYNKETDMKEGSRLYKFVCNSE